MKNHPKSLEDCMERTGLEGTVCLNVSCLEESQEEMQQPNKRNQKIGKMKESVETL